MDIAFFGIDSIIVSALYYFMKKKAKTLSDIEDAVQFDGKGELPDNVEYCMVTGKVKPEDRILKSNYDKDYLGVIRSTVVREHGTTFQKDVRHDTTKILSKTVEYEPFSILSRNLEIKVDSPDKAEYLLENLNLTHRKFEMNKNSLTNQVLTALIARQHTKGIETSEKMLLNGTSLTCFGRLVKDSTTFPAPMWVPGAVRAEYELFAPEGRAYIITTLTRSTLIDELKKINKTLKISFVIFGSIAIGIGIYMVYTRFGGFIKERIRIYRIEQARRQRIRDRRARAERENNEINQDPDQLVNVQNQNQNNHDNDVNNECVVCLTNPREVVLLDCGHVCLCMDCLERLPTENCPICRTRYRTFVPCYMS